MKSLASFVCGKWIRGTGSEAPLLNPATEEVLAQTSSAGVDFRAALTYARDVGGPELRRLTFAERAGLLRQMAKVVVDAREELIALAVANGGNTRGDAKFDIDGASFTLAAYAELGDKLGQTRFMDDGEPIQLGRTARFSGHHILGPRRGVAVHINAFNFPAWGLCEKAACTLLAGMPMVAKPATATALVAHRMVELFDERKVLPPGVLSLICGSAGDLIDHLTGQDVLAFTGSSETAHLLRQTHSIIANSVRVNVEADSLNAAILGPDVSLSSDTGLLFLGDVTRDVTQKAGQKCTAIRRVVVPAAVAGDVADALAERLRAIKVGNPASEGVGMGPVSSKAQERDVRAGLSRLSDVTDEVVGGAVAPVGAPEGKGFFVGPTLRRARDNRASAIHDREVFGPVATLLTYSDAAEAADLVSLGAGGLVASTYSDDREFLRALLPDLAPFHGRIYLGSEKMAAQSPGPGTVVPLLVHGGPGRAGGGEELGGLRGLALYQQRTALAGDKSVLRLLTE